MGEQRSGNQRPWGHAILPGQAWRDSLGRGTARHDGEVCPAVSGGQGRRNGLLWRALVLEHYLRPHQSE